MLNDTLTGTDVERLRTHIHSEIEARHIERDRFGLNPVLKALMTAKVAVGDIGLRRDSLLAIMLYESVLRGHYDTTLARKDFGEGVATILQGLVRVQELYSKTPIVESENFRNLLLSFAEDMRVVLIMIADRVCLMRQIRDTPNKEAQHEVAEEASYLYAPLAHKLGLYQLEERAGGPLAEVSRARRLLSDQGETQRHEAFPRRLHRALHRSGEQAPHRGRTQISYQGPHQVDPLHLAEDEEAEVWRRWHLRPLCHPHHPRLPAGEGEDAVLAGLLHRHRHVPAQPEAPARLDQRAEVQWLRVSPHHRARS